MGGLRSVLVVGAGSIGERHVRCFGRTERVRLAVCETNPALLRRVCDTYGATAHADFHSALADRPDVVVIATPAPLHVAMSTRAIEAGAALLIEKPLATAFEDPELVATLVRAAAGRAVGVAYVYRAHPALQAMRAAVVSGRLGRPVQLVVVAGQNFPTYRPAYRDTYYRDRASGGGAVQDALTHLLDVGQWLVGPADTVAAAAAHQVLPGVVVEDTVQVIARHGHVLATYSLNQHQAPNETTVTLVGDRGTARFESHRSRWTWCDTPDAPWVEETFTLERDDLFTTQATEFLDAIDGRRPPACPLMEGVRAWDFTRAVLQAAESGQWIEVPRTVDGGAR